MSRIGRLPVEIPAGVEVNIAENNVVTVKGPKGTLTESLPVEMDIKVEDNHVRCDSTYFVSRSICNHESNRDINSFRSLLIRYF